MKYSETKLKEAHSYCTHNRTQIEASGVCACFYCCKTFDSGKIEGWVHEGEDTALCPHCGIDSVIGDRSRLPIEDPAFLSDMHELWFERTYTLADAGEANLVMGVREQAEPFDGDASEDFRRHFTPEQIESIERGLDDARAGRTVSNEDVFAEIRAKYGW